MLNHSVPESTLIQIGDISVSFSLLESIIQLLAGSLISHELRIGQIVSAELSFRNLRALTISLYLERFGEDNEVTKIKDLMKRAGRIEDKRNQIIHSLWIVGIDEDHVTRIKGTAKEKHGFKIQEQDMNSSELREIADEIKQLSKDMQDFLVQQYIRKQDFNFPPERTLKDL